MDDKFKEIWVKHSGSPNRILTNGGHLFLDGSYRDQVMADHNVCVQFARLAEGIKGKDGHVWKIKQMTFSEDKVLVWMKCPQIKDLCRTVHFFESPDIHTALTEAEEYCKGH